MSILSVLNVLLTADGSKFDSAFAKSRNTALTFEASITKVGKAISFLEKATAVLAIAKVTQKLVTMTAEVRDHVDAQNNLSKRLGISYNGLVSLQHAAEKNGSSSGVMNEALEKMIHTIGEATSGSESAAKVFKDLGLSAYKLRAMGTERAFTTITSAIGGMLGPMDRANSVTAIFGKGQSELGNILGLNAEKLAEMRTEAERLGKTLSSDQIDNLVRLKNADDRLNNALKQAGTAAVAGLYSSIGPSEEAVKSEWAATLEKMADPGRGRLARKAIDDGIRIVDGRMVVGPVRAPRFDSNGREILTPQFNLTPPGTPASKPKTDYDRNPVYAALTSYSSLSKALGDGATKLRDLTKNVAPKAYGAALMYQAREGWSKVTDVGRAVGRFRFPIGDTIDAALDKAAEDRAAHKHELPGLALRGSQADYQATARQRLAQINAANEPRTKEEREKKQAQDVRRMVELLGGIKSVLGEAPKLWDGDK